MNRATFTAAVVLLMGAAYWKFSQDAASVAAATGDTSYTAGDAAMTAVDQITGALSDLVMPSPVAGMVCSDAGKAAIKSAEGLRLTRYYLGDGMATIGYGHAGSTANIPATCTQAQADAWFEGDIESRAARWVRLYVTVPLYQNQFDALCSIAYNMSPHSFKKFADQVNAGNGIDGIAQDSVSWVPASLQNGIQNRRNNEMAMFDSGVYYG